MILSEISIERPVLAIVMSLLIVIVGLICYQRLPMREYPNIDAPIVSVRTVYTGASATVMENVVTRPLEDALSGIEGIKMLKSESREEVSNITIEFQLERDPDGAAADVRDRISRTRGRLPDEVDEPVIAKVEADAQAVIWLALLSDRLNAMQITDIADRFVQDRLQALPGVANVTIAGERRYAMRISLDREKLAGYGLVVGDIENALRKQNIEIPAGRIESNLREFTVLAEMDLKTAEQFNQLIIREVKGYKVRLMDVGIAELRAADERNIVRVNGIPAVGLGVVKQSTANTLMVAQAVKAEIPGITASLPEGMSIVIAFDSSRFIEQSLNSVFHTLWEALLLVVLVTFVFLRSWRSVFIPFVTIPVSLIGAFIFLYILNFSVNVLTLLGIVLAIGLVVDDAIVMLENIHRRIEQGSSPLQAAILGSREIAFAVLAMTITLATVFAPMGLMTGNTGRLFREFALSVSCAVVVSGFVALTLTPMMCARLLKPSGEDKNHADWFTGMTRIYQSLLEKSLQYRSLMLLLVLVLVAAAYLLQKNLKSELAPLEDRSLIIGTVKAPEGATLDYTNHYALQIEKALLKIPEIGGFFMVVAPGMQRPSPVNSAMAFISLAPWQQRKTSQQAIAASLLPTFNRMPGIMAYPINPPSLGQNFRSPPVQFVIQAGSYQELKVLIDKMMQRAKAFPGLINLDSDLKLNKPQLNVDVDRDKAATLGVELDTIGRTLETLLGGRQVTRFKREGEQYDVIVKLADDKRKTPQDLTSIYVRNQSGQLIQLDNLVQVRETVAARDLNHFNRLRATTLSATLSPNVSLGEALDFLDKIAKEELPASARTELDGQSREFRESSATLLMVFSLAIVFIYLVLAAQFESFIDPLIILFTVPLALVGALASLHVTGGTFNVYSQIGMVMLIGLITKNGILIVEFANQLQAQGHSVIAAVTAASIMRLRPIVMTTLSTILGAIPLAIATGAGAESRHQIGWVVVGGLFIGTLFTIFVIPSVYTFLSHRQSEPGTNLSYK